MRSSLACLIVLSLIAPAGAADSIADQAQQAYGVFAGGLSQQDFLSGRYAGPMLRTIAGNWVRLNGPANKTGVETYGADTDKSCQTPAALTLASPDAFTLTLTTNLPNNNFSQTYTLIAGATFGEHTDAMPYLKAAGIGPDKTGGDADGQRALLLSLANGLVQIYRPSDDILTLTRDRGYPIVLARCPKE
jgi:hypothetical protein